MLWYLFRNRIKSWDSSRFPPQLIIQNYFDEITFSYRWFRCVDIQDNWPPLCAPIPISERTTGSEPAGIWENIPEKWSCFEFHKEPSPLLVPDQHLTQKKDKKKNVHMLPTKHDKASQREGNSLYILSSVSQHCKAGSPCLMSCLLALLECKHRHKIKDSLIQLWLIRRWKQRFIYILRLFLKNPNMHVLQWGKAF